VRYAASRAPQDFANLRMLATDINEKSLAIAKSNAERNGLAEAISVHRVEPDGPIFPPAVVDSASQ
jgi:methylase of polypeptide subunit release factors